MYRAYLTHCYQLIVASEPLLQQAIASLDVDGWEGELRAFYLRHLDDEKNHAAWLLEDIDGDSGTLHYGVAALAGMGYYLVLHVHPVALLGYMQALECNPIPEELVSAVAAECGDGAVRTLRLHAKEDPEHAKQIEAAFSLVPQEWKPLVSNTRLQVEMMLKGL